MKLTIKTNISPSTILKARGLGGSTAATKLLAETVARLSDPYVPMSSGAGAHMKEAYTIPGDGSEIVYRGPYAHFQYVGEVMVGAKTGSPYAKSGEPKVGTGRPLKYNGAPMRGAEWDKRMMADRGDEVTKAVADYVGGKPK
ncbi:MAG: minor capsid protein [Oscillospiraceae bacterium]|nr:minor capsid protein [Oscillospiraceae bacterium]